MTPKNTPDPPIQVKCAYCHKPFHFAPDSNAKAKPTGEVEIALECPYCQKQNMVNVPAKIAGKTVMFRGGKNHKA